MLEAVLTPEPSLRCFSYDVGTGEREVASWRDGCGDDYSITFTRLGAFARAFQHESPLRDERYDPPRPWPGLLEAVPERLRPWAEEASTSEDGWVNATVTLWRLTGDEAWSYAPVTYPPEMAVGWYDIQGSDLFHRLDGRPETYRVHAEEVEEMTLDLAVVRRVFAHEELTEQMVRKLNPERSLEDLAFDLIAIGYPTR
jgi:hypothetical protein